jgi:hypothetical protein
VIQVDRAARVLTLTLALLLLVPTLGIAFQDEGALERFHNRALVKWPDAAGFRADPVRYIVAAEACATDRVYPIEQITHFQKTLTFLLLRTAPEPRVTLGKEGHIFLNGADNQHVYRMFAAACVDPHSAAAAREVQSQLATWSQIGLQRRLAIDVVVVPVSESIYADDLPVTVPDEYRRPCLERMSGVSPLLSIAAPGTTFVYPLREMLAARGDDAFYPRGNWHPTGLSLKVVRDTYLSRLHTNGSVDETLELGSTPAELLMPYDIRLGEPTYIIHNPHVITDNVRNAKIHEAVADLFPRKEVVTHFFTNSRPVVNESVLMISDSYGDLASEVFAGAFAKVIHVNANYIQDDKVLPVIDRVGKLDSFGRLVLLMQEGNWQKLTVWTR